MSGKGLSAQEMQKMAVSLSTAPSECPMHTETAPQQISECPMTQGELGNQNDINPDNMVS